MKIHLITLVFFIIVFGISAIGCPSTDSQDRSDSNREKYQSKESAEPFKVTDVINYGAIPSNWKPYKIDGEGDYSYIVDSAFIGPDKMHTETPSSLHVIEHTTDPKVISSISLDGKGWDIAVKNGFAYVGTSKGLLTLDVHKPEEPELVNTFPSPYHVSKVFIRDKFMYFVDSSKSLNVFHLKNPAEPTLIYTKTIASGSSTIGFMEMDAEYAYISGTYSGLHIFDLIDPVNPERICIIDTSIPRSVVKHGNFLYMGTLTDSRSIAISIYDFSNPENPKKIDSFPIPDRPIKTVIHDDKLYAFCADGSVPVYDLTDPKSPVMLGKRTTGMKTDNFWFDDERIISINMSGNLQVCDFDWGIEEDGEFKVLASMTTPQSIRSFVLKGNHIFVVGDPPGLYCYDVSDPSDPRLINRTVLPGGLKDIAISGNFVYVKNANFMSMGYLVPGGEDSPKESKLRIFNIKNHEKPTFVGSIDLPKNADKIATDGKTLLVKTGSMGHDNSPTELFSIDVSKSSKPGPVRSILKGGLIHDFEVHGDYVYTASGREGFRIYRMEKSSGLKLISELSEFKWATGVAISGKKAYVASEDVKVVDISNPHEPSIIETLKTLSNARDTIISGHYAYVQRGMYGIVIVDLREPSQRPEIMNLGRNAHVGTFVVKEGYVIFIDRENSRSVLKSKKLPDSVLR